MTPIEPRLGDRSLFPDLAARAYLNHAAVSPASRAVLAACEACMAAYAADGLGASLAHRVQRERLREVVATLVGARPEEIGLVQNTTAGAIAIARSIPFQRGDRVVLFSGEFPANVTPFELVAADLGLEVVFVPIEPFERSDEEGLSALSRALEPGARLVAVSAVQFQTGLRMPLRAVAQLAHAAGAEIFVDGIQAVGAVPLDVVDTDIDYLAAGGHKFMMGLEGAGFLYVGSRAMAGLRLGLSGWPGHVDGFAFLTEGEGHLRAGRPLVRRASFVEQGSLSAVGFAALEASLGVIASLGVAAIFAHITSYLDELEPRLTALGCVSARAAQSSRRSASLSVRLPDGADLKRVAQSMGHSGIAVSTPDGRLRFAPHWPNALNEIDAVEAALALALRGGSV